METNIQVGDCRNAAAWAPERRCGSKMFHEKSSEGRNNNAMKKSLPPLDIRHGY